MNQRKYSRKSRVAKSLSTFKRQKWETSALNAMPAATQGHIAKDMLDGLSKSRKFQRSSTLKPVEPAIAIFEIFKNLYHSVYLAL
jgi:hypothetical protein